MAIVSFRGDQQRTRVRSDWLQHKFVPKAGETRPGSVADWLKADRYNNPNKRPLLVYYYSDVGESARACAQAMDQVLGATAGGRKSLYSPHASLLKINVSAVTSEQDPVVNQAAVPLIAVYGEDGTYVGHVEPAAMSERNLAEVLDKLPNGHEPDRAAASWPKNSDPGPLSLRTFQRNLVLRKGARLYLDKSPVDVDDLRTELTRRSLRDRTPIALHVDKDTSPYIYRTIRSRLRQAGFRNVETVFFSAEER